MLDTCQELADQTSGDIKDAALHAMETTLSHDVKRLTELQKVNPAVSKGEIQILRTEIDDLHSAISSSRLRLDSLRFITRGNL